MQRMWLKKQPLILKKSTLEAKEAKNAAAKHCAEEAKAILLKTRKDYEEQ